MPSGMPFAAATAYFTDVQPLSPPFSCGIVLQNRYTSERKVLALATVGFQVLPSFQRDFDDSLSV